ncbi:DNA alkylation repair protein [Agromyces sp. MMS24-K17]|uniref:DNA alkylation repair protein n=1 Tax=Agromyces sp. MMS24-K17 TaxID=3372850 RepID=UPI003754C9DC
MTDAPADAPSTPPTAADIVAALAEFADPERAAGSAWFFRTGPGGYAEGDRFLGVTMPQLRTVARRFADLPLAEADRLLESPFHEHRMCALVIGVERFRRAGRARTRDDALRADLHEAYLQHLAAGHVDNWDLVDVSAEVLVGEPCFLPAPAADPVPPLVARLVASDSLWERRVAMISTFAATKAGDARPALAVAERLIDDREDLIRKAVGWMLREVGKRVDRAALTGFLDGYAARLSRVSLSYATEHLDPEVRAAYRAMR